MGEHEHRREHQSGRVGLVQAGVFGRRAVHRLEHRHMQSDVGARSHPQPAHQTGAEVADDVAVEVGAEQHVVEFGLLHQLHAHVVDDAVLELDVRVAGSHRAADFQEEPVGALHDVGLVDRGHFLALLPASVVEGELRDALAAGAGDDLDGFRRVLAHHVLDPGIEVLGVLADDHQVDTFVARSHAGDGDCRPQVRVEVELLTQPHVHAAEARAHRGGDGAFDGHLRVFHGVDDGLGQRGAVLFHHVGAGFHVDPFDLNARRCHGHLGRRHDLGADPVAGDTGDPVGRHRSSLSLASWSMLPKVAGGRKLRPYPAALTAPGRWARAGRCSRPAGRPGCGSTPISAPSSACRRR